MVCSSCNDSDFHPRNRGWLQTVTHTLMVHRFRIPPVTISNDICQSVEHLNALLQYQRLVAEVDRFVPDPSEGLNTKTFCSYTLLDRLKVQD